MSATGWMVLAGLMIVTTLGQVGWVVRKHESNRLRHFFGLGTKDETGKFYWKEGVFAAEITEAMTPVYAQKHGWLLTRRNQRLFVVLNVASWSLYVLGAADLPWNLGFSNSLFSWWALLVVVAYLLVRQSVRVVIDAPDELLDERMRSIRDHAHTIAYRLMGWMIPLSIGFTSGIISEADWEFGWWGVAYGLFLFGFVYEALPNMVIAWRGSLQER